MNKKKATKKQIADYFHHFAPACTSAQLERVTLKRHLYDEALVVNCICEVVDRAVWGGK
ncbi:Uncharacterised protein [Serratia quinivorans]|uniref:hypothetical protein n=1 Tax=Serratia quinivorans TaxID=137545 RepID=UPI00217A6A6A|nr:hypothetical protein [Serratia quinivorans]CAI1770712.1 Uncharacterised protein [Serratia quinivorans]